MRKFKYITSILTLGVCLSCSTNIAFAQEPKVNEKVDKTFISQQLAEFDRLDKQIKENRSKMVLPDKASDNGSKMPTLASTGSYPTRKGVILVTKDGKFGSLVGHAGIVYNSSTTVESFPDGGVATYSNTWNTRYNTVYGATTSGTDSTQDASAADYAYGYRGTAYNWNFLDIETTARFYCSQLVYKAYKTKTGLNLNQGGGIVSPIDLIQSSNTYTIYTQGI